VSPRESLFVHHETLLQLCMAPFLRYADMLIKERAECLAKGQEFLTWNDVQKCIDTVNIQVHEEHEREEVLQISGCCLHLVACFVLCC